MTKTACERARTWVLTMLMTLSAVCGAALVPQTAVAQEENLPQKANQQTTLPQTEGIEIVDLATGNVVTSVNDASLFNPASNTKLATTLAVLQKFGPDHRFQTVVSTDGTITPEGVLEGDLYVDGDYMLFGDDQAHQLAQLLNNKGILKIQGNLYVSPSFTMRLQFQGLAAGQQLLAILDPNHPSGAVRHLRKPVVKRHAVPVSPPEPAQVLIYGKLKVGTLKSDHATVLGTHNSPPLKDIIKIMLCYSDNTMAQKFGEMIGGPKALTDMVITQLGVPAAEVNFATTSGLDVNRITPRAMMKVVTALRQYLIDHQLSLSDLLAVSGIDDGTMKDRLNDADEKGSVVSKTGTLTTTDEGASALSGEMHTKGISSSDATSDATATTTEGSGTEGTTPDSTTTTTTTSSDGTYLFVIFEMHGDVNGFRQRQNTLVSDFQKAHGGPQAITYTPILPRVNGEDFWK